MCGLDGAYKLYKMETVKTLSYENQKSINDEILKELDCLKKNIIADNELILKIGAQVMCIVNIETDCLNPIVNGSRGVVIDFTESGLPVVKFKCGLIKTIGYHIWELEPSLDVKIGYGVKQIPLILSWCLTIHKSQGLTIDIAEMDLGSSIFECGQIYVALSRVKDLSGLYLLDFNLSGIRLNLTVLEYYRKLNLC